MGDAVEIADSAGPLPARPVRLGLALAWTGWGAIAAQRFSAGAGALVFGAGVAAAGVFLVVLTRIQNRRRSAARTTRRAPRVSAAQAEQHFEARLFRELAPEAASASVQPKN